MTDKPVAFGFWIELEFRNVGFREEGKTIGLITSSCSGNEPALLSSWGETKTGLTRVVEIEPRET